MLAIKNQVHEVANFISIDDKWLCSEENQKFYFRSFYKFIKFKFLPGRGLGRCFWKGPGANPIKIFTPKDKFTSVS